MEPKKVEILAAIQHEIWAHWMRYLFECGGEFKDGMYFVIPPENVTRWMKQMRAPYSELSESEKESDRDQARKIIEVLELERIGKYT